MLRQKAISNRKCIQRGVPKIVTFHIRLFLFEISIGPDKIVISCVRKDEQSKLNSNLLLKKGKGHVPRKRIEKTIKEGGRGREREGDKGGVVLIKTNDLTLIVK